MASPKATGQEHPKVVVEHADNNSIQLSRGGVLRQEQVRPADGTAVEYRQGFRQRVQRSGSQRPPWGSHTGEGLEAIPGTSRCSTCGSRTRWRTKELKIDKVGTLENPADMLTKVLDSDGHSQQACRLIICLFSWVRAGARRPKP